MGIFMSYKSCGFINHGMEFRPNNIIAMCSQVSHIGGGNIILLKDFNPKSFDIEALVKKKREIADCVRKGMVYPNCLGCTDLKEWDELQELSKIKLLMIQHWTKCNSNCIYCFSAKDKKFYNSQKTYEISPILKKMIEYDILDKDGIANFSGGEFTCLKEANKIIDILTKLNYFIIVNSSGVDYSRKLAERLKKGNSCVIISVNAGSQDVHRRIKQVNTYKKVWSNIKKYIRKQTKDYLVNIKYIIVPGYNDNEEEINKFIDNCVNAGVRSIVLGIDANYFEANRENISDHIFRLFDSTREKVEKLNISFTIANRALTMLTIGKYANPFWEKYRFDDGVYADRYFNNI